jgi:hypothetical protein
MVGSSASMKQTKSYLSRAAATGQRGRATPAGADAEIISARKLIRFGGT